MRLKGSWKKADIFRRIPKDLTEATISGAVISILCVLVMILLFTGEVISYVFPRTQSDMMVARSKGSGDRLKVFLDIELHSLPCALASIDIVDVLKNHQADASDNLKKTPLDAAGKEIQDGRQPNELRGTNEGCRMQGYITVSRVPGNFHLSAHGRSMELLRRFPGGINVAHTIHQLAFEPVEATAPYRAAGSDSRPLDGLVRMDARAHSYQYFVDIVPTTYASALGTTNTYQYTVGEKKMPTTQQYMSVIMFTHQLSPIAVRYSSGRVSFTHFLTYICAIVGGVYTVAGLLSRFIYSSTAHIQKRFMGKGE